MLGPFEPPHALIGPISWGHSGPLCHALSLSLLMSSLSLSSWTSHAACTMAIAGVRMGPTFFKCFLFYIAIHQVSLLSHAATVARRLRIDVHDNNDNDNA